MKNTICSHIPAALFLAAVLGGCATPLETGFEMEKRAVSAIGRSVGAPTVWNTGLPPKIGAVYQMRWRRDGHSIRSYEPGLARVVTSALTDTNHYAPGQKTWAYALTDRKNIGLQLAHMGIAAEMEAKPLKTVRFSTEGVRFESVEKFKEFQDLLATNRVARELRAEVAADTDRRAKARKPADYARFWVVTSVLYAKGVSITAEKAGDWSGSIGVVTNSSLLEQFTGVTRLPSGRVSVGRAYSNQVVIASGTDVRPIAVEICPLSANSKTMYADETEKIPVAVDILRR